MPLVLDTHELERRPGTMRTVSLRAPAPADLGNEVIEVPAGSDLELDLRLESVLDGILVTGTVRAVAVGECARCLEPLERQLEVDIQELFAYPGHEAEEGSDEETSLVEDELIDLEPTVRDAVVIDLPLAPLCRDDCPGLCPECGALLAEDPHHQHDSIDARWAALQGLGVTVGASNTGTDTTTTNTAATNTAATNTAATNTAVTLAAVTRDDRLNAGGREES
jgi:uncharacterized protein